MISLILALPAEAAKKGACDVVVAEGFQEIDAPAGDGNFDGARGVKVGEGFGSKLAVDEEDDKFRGRKVLAVLAVLGEEA